MKRKLKILLLLLFFSAQLFAFYDDDGFYNPFWQKDESQELKELCGKKDAKACFLLAHNYEVGDNVVRDYKKAANFYQESCDLDFAEACNNLAILYQNGFGLPRNLLQAIQLYQKACKLGFDFACLNLQGFEVIYP